MTDELLSYYEKELAFIRQLGAEFATRHPKVAGHLKITEESIEDPHVARLIESVAYLNARIQYKLDDDFPELTDAMLGVLFPHYQRPIPSLSIIQLTPGDDLDAKYILEKGAQLEAESVHGACKYKTCYPVELYPIQLESASITGLPFITPGANKVKGAASVVCLTLNTTSTEIAFSDLKPDRLRFYIKGQGQHTYPLYDLLLKDCLDVVITTSKGDLNPKFLGKSALKPVGFDEDEGLLPYPAASFLGYRLITEFFAFPEKFLFMDIEGLSKGIPQDAGQQLNIYIYLGDNDIELERNVNKETFAFFSTPIINLFEQQAEPIRLDHTQDEYLIVPDSGRPSSAEVYSIDEVKATSPDDIEQQYQPIYGLKHDLVREDAGTFWHATRRSGSLRSDYRDSGTDVFINLIDVNFEKQHSDEYTLEMMLTCSNRDLPAQLPYGSNEPVMHFLDASPPADQIRCIRQPTAPIRPPLRNRARWRLISHLNLNHLSITGGEDATNALKEILRLYDFKDSAITRAIVNSISSIETTPVSAPITINERATICRGTEIRIELDGSSLAGSSAYLFASVLEHFFSLYCSINSFTRVIATLKGKEGVLKKCPARAGEKVLL